MTFATHDHHQLRLHGNGTSNIQPKCPFTNSGRFLHAIACSDRCVNMAYRLNENISLLLTVGGAYRKAEIPRLSQLLRTLHCVTTALTCCCCCCFLTATFIFIKSMNLIGWPDLFTVSRKRD